MSKIAKKLITSVICSVFAFTNSVLALPAVEIGARPFQETPNYFRIDIPQELATVEEIYEAPARTDPRLVLHIQNAHGNYDAQVRIKKLLEYLHNTYKFNLLFVEGAAEELNAEYLRFFRDEGKNIRVADYLAKRGQLTGAEYYMMDAPKEVKAIGIEEVELYRSNYEAFKKVYSVKVEVENFLTDYESTLDLLSSRFFTPDTRRLLSEWKKFEQGNREFLPYVKQLSIDARKFLGLDLTSLFAQVEWPQITRLLALQTMESELNREKALKEKNQLVMFLKGMKATQTLIQGVDRLEEKHISMNRLDPGAAGLEYAPRHLLETLVAEAGPKGFNFYDYPAFSLYAGYLILQSELESQSLFEEIEALFKKILDELTLTERERDLMELFRDEDLLRKLLKLELSRKEWARAYYRRDWIHPDAIVKRLETIRAAIAGTGKHQFDYKSSARKANSTPLLVDTYFIGFRFYDFAQKRETVFYEKIKKEMDKQKTEKAILITGGFHTDGLMDLFREDKVSYGILTPRIAEITGNDNYVQTMMESHPTIFDLSYMEAQNLALRSEIRVEMGCDPANTVEPFLNAIVLGEGIDKFNVRDLKGTPDIHFTRMMYDGQLGFKVEVYREDLDRFVPFTIDGREVILPLIEEAGGMVKFKGNYLLGNVQDVSDSRVPPGNVLAALGIKTSREYPAGPPTADVPATQERMSEQMPFTPDQSYVASVGWNASNLNLERSRQAGQSPQVAVAFIAGLIVAVGDIDALKEVARIIQKSEIALPQHLVPLKGLLERYPSLLASSSNPSGLIIVSEKGVSEDDMAWALLELTLHQNQVIAFLIVDADAQTRQISESHIKIAQERWKQIFGSSYSDRLYAKFMPLASLGYVLQKMKAQIEGMLQRRAMTEKRIGGAVAAEKFAINNRLAVLLPGDQYRTVANPDTFPGLFIYTLPDKDSTTQSKVGGEVVNSGAQLAELDQRIVDCLSRKSDQEMQILARGLDALQQVLSNVLTEIRTRFLAEKAA